MDVNGGDRWGIQAIKEKAAQARHDDSIDSSYTCTNTRVSHTFMQYTEACTYIDGCLPNNEHTSGRRRGKFEITRKM